MRDVKLLVACVAVLVMTGLLVGCGGDTKSEGDPVKDRDPFPFLNAKFKNTGAEGEPPAIVTVKGKKSGQPTQTHKVGPVDPGTELSTTTRGTDGADEVEITVKFGPGVVLSGTDSYPGSNVKVVTVEANQAGGTATVKFHSGQPEQTVTLTP